MLKRLTIILTMASLLMGCEVRSHGHYGPKIVAGASRPEYGIVETTNVLYDFINQYDEYCYGTWDDYGYGDCIIEYCLDDYSFSPNGWYTWHYYCV